MSKNSQAVKTRAHLILAAAMHNAKQMPATLTGMKDYLTEHKAAFPLVIAVSINGNMNDSYKTALFDGGPAIMLKEKGKTKAEDLWSLGPALLDPRCKEDTYIASLMKRISVSRADSRRLSAIATAQKVLDKAKAAQAIHEKSMEEAMPQKPTVEEVLFPCHTKSEDQWCDKDGPGGFMGHTCENKTTEVPQLLAGTHIFIIAFDIGDFVYCPYYNITGKIMEFLKEGFISIASLEDGTLISSKIRHQSNGQLPTYLRLIAKKDEVRPVTHTKLCVQP